MSNGLRPPQLAQSLESVAILSDHGPTEDSSLASTPLGVIAGSTSTSSTTTRKRQLTIVELLAQVKRTKPNPEEAEQPAEERQSTVECLPRSSATISSGKSRRCKKSTPRMKSTKTLVRDSTTSGKRSRGFWDSSKAEISKRLWWPTETVWPGSELTLSNGLSPALEHLSSFSIRTTAINPEAVQNSQKTFLQWSTCSLAGSTASEDIFKLTKAEGKHRRENAEEKKEITPRVTRIQIRQLFPSQKQHSWLMRWFKDARTTYNMAVGRILKDGSHKLKPQDLNLAKLEGMLVKSYVSKEGVLGLNNRHHKLLRTPKVIRQQAVKSVIAMMKRHHTMWKKNEWLKKKYPQNKKFQKAIKFHPKFKSRKLKDHDSINFEIRSLKVVDDDCVSLYSMFKSHKGGDFLFRNLKCQSGVNELTMEKDFKIHYRFGKLYLLMPVQRKLEFKDRLSSAEAVAAIDPGVRVPFTVYSPQGSVVEIGVNSAKVLDKLHRRIKRKKKRLQDISADVQLQRQPSGNPCTQTTKRQQRNKIRKAKKAYHDAEDKSKRVIRDFHYKTAHYLLQRFHTIILPTTSSHHWRKGKRLAAITKKRAMTLSLGAFASRLVETASMYKQSVIKRGSEAYTSKQCGNCGVLNDQLGSSKFFCCRSCGRQADRDMHAARNILLRLLKS